MFSTFNVTDVKLHDLPQLNSLKSPNVITAAIPMTDFENIELKYFCNYFFSIDIDCDQYGLHYFVNTF